MAKNNKGVMTGEPVTFQTPAPAGGVQMETFIPWTLVKRGVRCEIITPIDAPQQFQKEAVIERAARKCIKDSPMIRALGLAHYWQWLLDDGKYRSLTEIAEVEGLDLAQTSRIARLAGLAPDIVTASIESKNSEITIETLARCVRVQEWGEQSKLLKYSSSGSIQ
jgi:hypothetical protein